MVSPDTGGAKRAELFREALETARGRPVGKAFVDKHRSAGVVSGAIIEAELTAAIAVRKEHDGTGEAHHNGEGR